MVLKTKEQAIQDDIRVALAGGLIPDYPSDFLIFLDLNQVTEKYILSRLKLKPVIGVLIKLDLQTFYETKPQYMA